MIVVVVVTIEYVDVCMSVYTEVVESESFLVLPICLREGRGRVERERREREREREIHTVSTDRVIYNSKNTGIVSFSTL